MRARARRLVAILGLTLVTVLCLAPLAGAVGERAGGTLIDVNGNPVGPVALEQLADGVKITVTLNATTVVKPGNHGIHFHAVGKCDGPDFASAGGHYNPTSKQHGTKNPQGPHAGDLPNLPVDAATTTYTVTSDMVSVTPGAASVFDADGTALIIHANPDDEMTDPSGNSGGRIACAVLTAQAATPGLPNTGAGGMAAPTLWGRTALLALATLPMMAVVAIILRRRTV